MRTSITDLKNLKPLPIYTNICKYTYDSLTRSDEICKTFICSKILPNSRHRRNHRKTFFKMFGTRKMSSVEVTERPIVWTIYLGIFNSKIYKGAHYITSIISRWVFEEFLTIGLLNGRCCKSFRYIQAACVTAYKEQQLTTCFFYVQQKLAIWISECCCRRQWLYSIFKLINNFNKQEGIIMRYKPHLLLHCFLDIASCSWWPLFQR